MAHEGWSLRGWNLSGLLARQQLDSKRPSNGFDHACVFSEWFSSCPPRLPCPSRYRWATHVTCTTIGGVLGRFTDSARSVVNCAEREAHATGSQRVASFHLLRALLVEADDNLVAEILAERNVDRSCLQQEIESIIWLPELADGERDQFTTQARAVLQESLHHALALGQNEVAPEHILLALASVADSPAGRLLRRVNLDVSKVRSQVTRMRDTQRDRYFESLPLKPSRDLRRVLIATIGHAQATGASEVGVHDLMIVLSRNREIPLLRRAALDEAVILGAIADGDSFASPPT